MIRTTALLFIAATIGRTTSAAAADNRIQTRAYEPDTIVRIAARPGIQSTIEFGSDERIENVAVGDSSAWQVTPNRRASLLFVKPVTSSSRTNMTVVTDRRTYIFDLVTGTKGSTPIYALRFTYPDEKPAEAKPELAPANILASAPTAPSWTPARLNFEWKKKGSGRVMPDRAFDDGAALFLSWDKERPLPAVLTLSENGREGSLNYQMNGEYIVVSPVPSNILLRYGKKAARLWPTRTPYRGNVAVPARSQPVVLTQQQAPSVQGSATGTLQQAAQAPARAAAPAPPRPKVRASSKALMADAAPLLADNLTDAKHEH
jgi:type IV secretion system protein VirB9